MVGVTEVAMRVDTVEPLKKKWFKLFKSKDMVDTGADIQEDTEVVMEAQWKSFR